MSAKGTTANTKDQYHGGKLSDKIDPVQDAKAIENLITARIGLLLKAPFFGNMATRLKMINADSWLPTAATDGRNFYYNTDFVNRLPAGELEFLFGHEILHNVYDHMGRVDSRDPRLWNCAADYAVNADLIDQRIGTKINPCLFDRKYAGMSAEEIYDDLYENAEKVDVDQLLDQMIDEHLEGEGADGDSGEDGDQKDGKGNGRPKYSKEEREQIKNEVREALLQSAQAAGAGGVPAGVKRLIKDLTNPVVNWRELLEQQIQSILKDDFSWMRPSRRGWHQDAIMPGMIPGEEIEAHIAIDMSGSIGDDDARAFLTEIKGIMESYDSYKIHIWCFDTEIYNHQVFDSENGDDILNYEPQGGGGTDFEANWNYMKDNGIEPKKFIMFTDGYPFGSWGDENYCDTVWIIKGNERAEPPFGVWAIYEHAKEKASA